MKFIKFCPEDKNKCSECIKSSNSTEKVKSLRLAFLDLPKWEPCEVHEEEETDKIRGKEIQDFLTAKHMAEEEAKNYELMFN